MRLTLRTLLAYLDDILDPAAKEELAKKIESSELAKELVHRSRDTMRRLRLSAPQVIGTGMGLDPNTVAEYLDNVMAPSAIADFERICLESDVHLAEAAACHHVLTMVLGEPADVEPRAKQRMYTIAADGVHGRKVRIEPAHANAAASAAPVAMQAPAAAAAPAHTGVEVPEYLRTGGWGWRFALAGLAALVLVGVTILLVSGLRGWFAEDEVATNTMSVPVESAPAEPPMEPPSSEPVSSAPVSSDPGATVLGPPPQPLTPGMTPQLGATTGEAQTSPYSAPADGEVTSGSGATDAETVGTLVAEDGTLPPATTESEDVGIAAPQVDVAGPLAAATAPQVGARYATPDETQPDASTASETAIPGSDAASIPRATVNLPPQGDVPPGGPAGVVPPSEANRESVATAETGSVAAASPEVAPGETVASTGEPAPMPPVVPPGPADLGSYLGGSTVLLRLDEKSGEWRRMEARTGIFAGDQLVAFPEFRPVVALHNGFYMDLLGGTRIVPGVVGESAEGAAPPTGEIVPAISVIYGRVVLYNSTNADRVVHLTLGPNSGSARLAPKSKAAVEVEKLYVPGNDPMKTMPPVIARGYAPMGGVEWNDASGAKMMDASTRLTFSSTGPLEVAPEPSLPTWIDEDAAVEANDRRTERRLGAPYIEPKLVSNADVKRQLAELLQDSRRKEVTSVLAKGAVHVGLFSPLVEGLRDESQRPYWESHIQALRRAMASSPDAAAEVRSALAKKYGNAADDLYQMLCGYGAEQVGQTPEEFETGAVPQLIAWLGENNLEYRVLAVQNLKEITGKELMMNPAASVSERTKSVKVWTRRLKEEGIGMIARPE